MCARRTGTLPNPRLHERGYQRISVVGRDFKFGTTGSQQVDEQYKIIPVAWADGEGSLPDDFKFDSEPKKH